MIRLTNFMIGFLFVGCLIQPIPAEEIAPDQDEACFKGTFMGKQQRLRFSLRVTKDKESDKWRVGYFHFEDSR